MENVNEVIEGCIKGDGKSQEILYKAFYPKMFGMCMRYAKNTELAKDLLQEGFIKVFANINKYSKLGSIEGWVRRVILNHVLEQYRKNKKHRLMIDRNVRVDGDETINERNSHIGKCVEITEHNEYLIEKSAEEKYASNIDMSVDDLMSEVQKLTPRLRTVFNLYVVDDYCHKDIAKMLGVSESQSKCCLLRARAKLQARLIPMIKKINIAHIKN